MKKKKLIIIIFLLILSIGTYISINNENNNSYNKEYKISKKEKNSNKNIIKNLRKKYNNDDIEAYLEIPDLLEVPVAKTYDNNYYLTHDLYKKKEKKGAIFMDYRNTIEDRKILIYGHNSTYRKIIFSNLHEYLNENFYKKHKYFYLYTQNKKNKYNIFSVYVENSDFDYVNLNDFNGLTYEKHLKKLKNKSLYKTNINVNKNSKIVILQTCNFDEEYEGNTKYQLVMGVLENK